MAKKMTMVLLRKKGSQKTEEIAPNVIDGSNEAKSAYVETDNNITDMLKTTTHTRNATDFSVTEKCASKVVEKNENTSNDDQVQETESTEQYNLLLNQYNAVEKQRQKLLEQLYQYGNWDYQGYGYDITYDSQTSEPPTCTCHPFVCSYSTAPAVSSCVGNSVSLKDDGFIKEAMGAVDKAIHSFNKETSDVHT